MSFARAGQEAALTLIRFSASAEEIGLVLKADLSAGNFLDVLNDPSQSHIEIWTCESFYSWTQWSTIASGSFSTGDRFRVTVTSAGLVTAYRNSTAVGTADLSGWSHVSQSGKIGLELVSSTGTILDDFGGGTLAQGQIASPWLAGAAVQVLANGPWQALASAWKSISGPRADSVLAATATKTRTPTVTTTPTVTATITDTTTGNTPLAAMRSAPITA